MNDLTFSEFAKYANIPRTTVYTRLNNIKKHNPEQYRRFVFQEENTLKIYGDRADELKQYIDSNHYEPYMQQLKEQHEETSKAEGDTVQSLQKVIDTLREELDRSEDRYSRLFDDYLRLSATLQQVSERLMQLSEDQQESLKEAARPQTWEEKNQEHIQHLAHVIGDFDNEPSQVPSYEEEEEPYPRDQRTRSEIRVESEFDENKGLLGRLFK